MSTSIIRLPDEILAKILNRLSLQELAPLDLVSHRWKSVQEYVLKQISSLTLYKKHFVWLHDDFYGLMFFKPLRFNPRYDENSLVDTSDYYDINGNADESSELHNVPQREWLVHKLPNITKLSLWGSRFFSHDIKNLFDHWTQIEQFNIYHDAGKLVKIHLWIPQINRLASLKHLGLFSFVFVAELAQLELLPQLETLCLNHETVNCYLDFVLPRLGPKIRHLSLVNFICNEEVIANMQNFYLKDDDLGQTLSTQVTRVTIQGNEHSDAEVPLNLKALNFFVENFCALTHLDVCLSESLYLNEIVGSLSRLKQLASLRLSTLSSMDKYPRIFKVNEEQFNKSIPSVQTLHLSILPDYGAAPKATFYQTLLPIAFPNLLELRLENSMQMYQCDNCGYDDVITLDSQIMEKRLFDGGLFCSCIEKLLDAFVKMKLRTVYRNTILVFHHKLVCLEHFALRLERFGQSKYCRRRPMKNG